MRTPLALFGLLVLSLAGSPSRAHAQVNLGVSIGEEGVRGFYLGVGEYFRVPQREVIIIRERRIPEEEIPVVFFIAQRARVEPATVVNLRLRGKSWLDITLHYGLSPEIYYVPVPVVVKGPPYGKAYGYFKNKPRKEWKTIVLSDHDVVNLVNLKFVSEHYGYPPEQVIKWRSEGKNFVVINHEIRKEKEKGRGRQKEKGRETAWENHKGGGKGKGR